MSTKELSEKIGINSHILGFSVEEKSKPKNALVTHRILQDEIVESTESLNHPAHSIQYHPETALDSRDASYLFGRFLEKMKS